jgi:hypothetical protein
MNKDFTLQMRAIRNAMRQLNRDRVAAVDKKNQEWIDDIDADLEQLQQAVESIQLLDAISKFFNLNYAKELTNENES